MYHKVQKIGKNWKFEWEETSSVFPPNLAYSKVKYLNLKNKETNKQKQNPKTNPPKKQNPKFPPQ